MKDTHTKTKYTEKIDGVIAMIMALDRAIRCGNEKEESFYDSQRLLILQVILALVILLRPTRSSEQPGR